MKIAGLMAVFIALAAQVGADDPRVAAPAPVRQQLEEEYRYELKPEALPKPETPPVTEQKVEKLDPVVVTAAGRNRDLDANIRLRDLARQEMRFSLLNGGGTLLERQGKKVTTEVQLKLVSVRHGAGVDVLRFSW